jgi:3-deoxy-D-manno-octulosonic-acid transferase
MEQLRREHPEYKILLTFFSPSGYEVRKNYEGADIITYLPLDTITNARRFLRTVRPVMAFFIKYEFWYNYLHILKHRNIPVYSVSSIFRPEQVFFKWYGRQYGRVLKCFTHFFVQNEISKDLLEKIHITNVTVVGDTRFDRVLQIKEAAKYLPIVETFKQDTQVFVAGSSWPPDEAIFIPYFNKHPEWKMIIAPHVIGEDHLRQIEKLLEGRKVMRYSSLTEADLPSKKAELQAADVLIIDCFGLLSSIYHYGEIAYVGGGFGVGIHNVLEAAVWDVPVFFGPNNQRFQEAQGLKAAGGGFDFETAEAFTRQMDVFLTDAEQLRIAGVQAGKFVQGLAGATEKVLSSVKL